MVNDIWGGEKLCAWNAKLWEHDLDDGLRVLRLAVDTHLITSHYALPLVIRQPGGLVVEMTDGTTDYNAGNYRVSAFYDLAKCSDHGGHPAQLHQIIPGAEFSGRPRCARCPLGARSSRGMSTHTSSDGRTSRAPGGRPLGSLSE